MGRADGGAHDAIFEVSEEGEEWVVRGAGGFAGQLAVFSGPDAWIRALAYAEWMNAGAAFQRRRTDPGFMGRSDPRH